jgi:hypothetical protein
MSSNLDVGPYNSNTAVFQEVLATGVSGMAFNGTQQVAPFNTEVVAQSFASLSSDQITLDAGVYLVQWRMPTIMSTTEYVQVSAYDTVGAANLGGGRFVAHSAASIVDPDVYFYITIATSKVIEIRVASYGAMSATQPNATNNTGDNYYNQVTFTKKG